MPEALQLTPMDTHNESLLARVHPPDWQNPTSEGRYNMVVIGAGTAGLVTAAGVVGLGGKVALIERYLLGGDCLNYGCVPSKSLIAADRTAAEVRRADRYGVAPGGGDVDFPAVMERVRRIRSRISVHDAAAMDEHRAAIVFADVSGHGMSAALITVIVKMAFRTWMETGWSVVEFVRCVNRDLERFTPDGSFVVLAACIYDDRRKQLTYVNAGHNPKPFCIPGDPDEPVESLEAVGSMLLGVESDIDIIESTELLGPADAIVFATDGLTEAQNTRSEQYGAGRLARNLQAHRSGPLSRIVGSFLEDAATFTADVEPTDDRTVRAAGDRDSTVREGQ